MTHAASWRVRPFTESDGKAVCTWSYPAPYNVYNWPSWDELSARSEEFADPDIRERQYGAVVDERDELCGFVQFFPLTGVTRLGLGIRPDLCGQGLGPSYVEHLVAEARRRYPGNEIDLEVLVRNERAIKAYIRAGFAITDTYERMTPTGMAMMHCMVYGAEPA